MKLVLLEDDSLGLLQKQNIWFMLVQAPATETGLSAPLGHTGESTPPSSTGRFALHRDGRDSVQNRDIRPSAVPGRFAMRRQRLPQADLQELVSSGLIQNGQILRFRDNQGREVPQFQARISGAKLEFKGSLYSMSDLARVAMEANGHKTKSGSYRGPQFWFTESGQSIMDVWNKHLVEKGLVPSLERLLEGIES